MSTIGVDFVNEINYILSKTFDFLIENKRSQYRRKSCKNANLGYCWTRTFQDNHKHLLQRYIQMNFYIETLTYILLGSQGIILVFDLTDQNSFKNLEYWINEMKKFIIPFF